MAIEAQDFTIYQGDERLIGFTIYQEDNITALDITAATFLWVVAKRLTDTPVISKTSGAGISFNVAANGTLLVQIVKADTDKLQSDYQHELIMTLGGEVKTVSTGTVTIKPSAGK